MECELEREQRTCLDCNVRQRCSDSSFFESDSSPDARGRKPDPHPVCNTTMKSES